MALEAILSRDSWRNGRGGFDPSADLAFGRSRNGNKASSRLGGADFDMNLETEMKNALPNFEDQAQLAVPPMVKN